MKAFFLMFFLVTSSMSYAQQQHQIHLWPGKVPGENMPKSVPVQLSEGGVLRISLVTDPVLEVYPATPVPGKNTPAVIICPGGGYSILAVDLEGREIATWLNSQGITAFVLQYRVPQKKDGALQDAQRAMRLVRSRAAEYQLNPDKIGIMGFSAGGSLSARLNSRYADTLYTPVDGADLLSAKPDFCVLVYPAYLDSGPGNSLSPELKLNADTAPVFIFQTSDDPYGNSALVMASALHLAKIPVELHFYPAGGHGYGLRPGGKAVATIWPGLLSAWLKTQLH